MPRPSAAPQSERRSLTEWGVRSLFAAAAIWFGYDATTRSLAESIRGSTPDRAHSLAPQNGRIAAAYARDLLEPDATAKDRALANALARDALRRNPVAVPAVSTLGLNAQIEGDTAAARRIFAYAEKLTRRDLQTQLWAIEDAVARDDIPGALYQYDIALRTQRNAGTILFPVLVGALSEPSVRQALVDMLTRQPPWGNEFVNHAAAAGTDPRATLALVESMRRANVPVPALASARVIDALLASGDGEAAWRYYASLYPQIERDASRDPRFTARLEAPTRFDWLPVENAGVTATMEVADAGGRFDFITAPGAGGNVLRQTQMLRAGDYLIEGVAGVEQTGAPSPYWLLACAGGTELGRVAVIPTGSRFMGSIHVPSNCPVQTLTLVVQPSERMASVVGQVTEARIRKASSQR